MKNPEKSHQVVCVCGGHGYPWATATAARITMIGRALLDSGIGFRLLHCGPSPIPVNTVRAGVFEGISFEYMTSVRRPRSRVMRLITYIRAVCNLTRRLLLLAPRRRSTVVYLYVMDSPLAPYTGILCHLLRIPVVQEMCEWLPGDPAYSPFVHWLHKRALFRYASGVLVISKAIEERVARKRIEIGRRLHIHRTPALVDSIRFWPNPPPQGRPEVPEFVYCGTWRKDILYLINTFALLKQSGRLCRLRIIGALSEPLGPALSAHMAHHGLTDQDVVLAGCVDDRTLRSAYCSAAALLMPLWDDDRSLTRLPNKLSEYLASGRPVITCRAGDAGDLLTDGVSAYLAVPGDSDSFLSKMHAVLDHPEQADRIGAAGREVCATLLDYRSHSQALADFFRRCMHQPMEPAGVWQAT